MELWTWTVDGQGQVWSLVGLALDSVSRARPAVRRLLVVERDAGDEEESLAVIRLVRGLASEPVAILAGSSHPSAQWRRSVREAGADRTLLVGVQQEIRCNEGRPLDGAVDIGEALCPDLKTLRERHHTVSVCCRQKERVLARQHLERWCIVGKAICPHWQGEPGG